MTPICLYFQVHQPYRLRRDYNFFHIGWDHLYDDDALNRQHIRDMAETCYLPANAILLDTIRHYDGRFKLAFSITGTALELFRMYAPEVVSSFRKLVKTGCVELLNETYYHSLAFLFCQDEFRHQVAAHRLLLQELFDYTPRAFRNTEMIYSNSLAEEVKHLGFDLVLSEGANQILGWRTADFVYRPTGVEDLRLLLKNYRLSDNLAFRFSNRDWEGYPLTPEKYAASIREAAEHGDVINLFMDYETFGGHHPAESGILDFLQQFPVKVLESSQLIFQTPSEIAADLEPKAAINTPFFISWGDIERDLTAWTGNPMQDSALEDLYELRQPILEAGDPDLLRAWRRLQSSDHFYYMCTKWFSDKNIHKHFNPFPNPHDAYIIYMNVLNDIRERLHSGPAAARRAAPKP